MRLVFSVALSSGVICGAVLGAGSGARARSGQQVLSAAPIAASPVSKLAPAAPPLTAPVEAPLEPEAGAESGTELDAVLETPAAASLVANTPMDEEDAAVHLARAWRAVFDTNPSEQTLSVLWAQWAHETARGRRMHAYNFAGIKGSGPSGASVVVWTREGASSSDLVRRTFRAYRTPSEGARDYVRLLANRYPSALRAARAGNAYGFVSALDAGGYFTADTRAYLRAVTSLSGECRRRGLGGVVDARAVAAP